MLFIQHGVNACHAASENFIVDWMVVQPLATASYSKKVLDLIVQGMHFCMKLFFSKESCSFDPVTDQWPTFVFSLKHQAVTKSVSEDIFYLYVQPLIGVCFIGL